MDRAPGSGYGELALAALRPLQSALDRHPDRLVDTMGIGGAAGKELHELSSSEEQRLARARVRGRIALASLAEEACQTSLSLVCQPTKPLAYGDLVPLGFLLRACNADVDPAVRRDLEDLLRTRRQGLLWPYHTGTLVTFIDSALVLQGFEDPAGVEVLEIFADGHGGYFPQLCSESAERNKMVVTQRNRHRVISTSLAVLALTRPRPPVEGDAPPPTGNRDGSHPRYRCEDPMEYVANFALPPYSSVS